MLQEAIAVLRRDILGWYDGRVRPLPWRGEREPYRIWVSEIMLQQTRAETVMGYYGAFMGDYPDVRALADAPDEDVLKHWEGLGYYSRARNLHRAAKMVAYELGGVFPGDAKGLRELPGVGEYTAGMIASIAYGQAEPAIDGNQIRVLSRIFEVDDLVRSPLGVKRIRACAEALLAEDRPGDFNQALMDMGASVCKPKNADCANCPAEPNCLACRRGQPERLPVLPEKALKRAERRGVAMVVSEGKVLVRRRPEQGLLGGLWEFPNFLDATSKDELVECLLEMGVGAHALGQAMNVKHVFTHLIWMQVGRVFVANQCMEIPGAKWVNAEELNALPMSTAIQTYREAVLRHLEETSQ